MSSLFVTNSFLQPLLFRRQVEKLEDDEAYVDKLVELEREGEIDHRDHERERMTKKRAKEEEKQRLHDEIQRKKSERHNDGL